MPDVVSVMAAYNRLNGTYCAQHEWLLTDVLRGEWGFDGIVISDWWGTKGDESIDAGLDLEMPGPPKHSGPRAAERVRAGELDESVLDDTVRRLLRHHGATRRARPGPSRATNAPRTCPSTAPCSRGPRARRSCCCATRRSMATAVLPLDAAAAAPGRGDRPERRRACGTRRRIGRGQPAPRRHRARRVALGARGRRRGRARDRRGLLAHRWRHSTPAAAAPRPPPTTRTTGRPEG